MFYNVPLVLPPLTFCVDLFFGFQVPQLFQGVLHSDLGGKLEAMQSLHFIISASSYN